MLYVDKRFPRRKQNRLQGYDYSQAGCYFITICVKDKHELLGYTVGRDALGAPDIKCDDTPYVHLSEHGRIVQNEIEKTQEHYENIVIPEFVVMPNHVHMIIVIENDDMPRVNDNGALRVNDNGAPRADNNGAPRASRPTISNIVGIIKRKTNKVCGFNMWQTSYHDRIIRTEEEYKQIRKYIQENPQTWLQDCYYE
jgi:REP element-mobilizing transposase RayT